MSEEYIRKVDAWSAVEQANGNITWAERDDCHKRLVNLPSADVVPVVRCKDCDCHGTCTHEQYLGLDGFCSHGERREE